MTERDMEDLIASFPDDFFPRKKLVLKGRQESFAGIGRFDLLFEDEFQSTILMELKVRPAKYEDASQVARYRDELKRQGCKNIVMWLIAPQIPPSVREFLEDKGIEYSEIHLSEFRRVAERHDSVIKSEAKVTTVASQSISDPAYESPTFRFSSRPTIRGSHPSTSVATGPIVTVQSKFRWRARGFDLALDNPADLDHQHFSALVDTFEHSVTSKKNTGVVVSLRQWAENAHGSALPFATIASLLRWVTTSSYKAAVPCAEAIWTYLFGEPVPTWYVWNQGRRSYEFDAAAWRQWYDSLNAKPTPARSQAA